MPHEVQERVEHPRRQRYGRAAAPKDPFNGVEAKVIEFEDVGAAGLVHRMRVQNVSGRFR